ncbi:MAG: M28 family peptidase [Terracidiphilus sp.]|nr:M28 family peptidase [Terracidiphilus sp.]
MKWSKAALACTFFAPCLAWAQTAATSPMGTLDATANAEVVRLGGQLMLAGKAYEYDRVLADDYGPRLTGSANYAKAAEWATGEFQRLGLSNVHREAWEIGATWEPETWASAEIVAPRQLRLHLESDGWSPSTPPGGVRGKVYYLDAFTSDAIKTHAEQIKGAVVLVDGPSFRAAGELLIGRFLDTMAQLADTGAQALLFGMGTTNNASSMLGVASGDGVISKLPTADVGAEDTQLLRRLLEHGAVEVEFHYTNRIREHVKVDNVVAEIPGTEPNGEYVIIGGHLDSWHLGTGAEDNGTGAASVLAIAQGMMATGVKPRRTVRFVLFGGEEEGLFGSVHYARDHANELAKCAGVFVTDSGAEPPKGWLVFGRDDEKQALAPIKPLLSALGAGETSDSGDFTFSTDHAPFLIHGVPAFVLWTGLDKYMKLHHKPSDTYDKVEQRDLNLGVAVVGVTALAFADAPQSMRHLSLTETEDQLKSIKSYEEYVDLRDHHMF